MFAYWMRIMVRVTNQMFAVNLMICLVGVVGGGPRPPPPKHPLWGLVGFGGGQKMLFSRGIWHFLFRTCAFLGSTMGQHTHFLGPHMGYHAHLEVHTILSAEARLEACLMSFFGFDIAGYPGLRLAQ
jgi:hypothetical protein